MTQQLIQSKNADRHQYALRCRNEQKKLANAKKDSSSGGDQNPFENQNSSFGENQTSFWRRMVADRESKPFPARTPEHQLHQ